MGVHELDLLKSIPGGLLEGPRYDSDLGLIYADAAHGGVFSLGPDGPRLLIPHRKGIGGLILHASGGAVITGRNVAYKAFTPEGAPPAPTVVLLDRDPSVGRVGFNDLTTDASGRVFVGSLGFVAMHDAIDGHAAGPPGSLFVIDIDGSVRTLADDLQLSNGMAFTADGTRLYQCDSGRELIFAYDLEPGTTTVTRRSVFTTVNAGVPDGIAVAEDGNVWVALAHAGRIAVFSANAVLVEEIAVPVPMVTSLCFGGPDLRTLYVVTGSEGADPATGAGIFATEVAVPGVSVAPAKTPTNASESAARASADG